MGQSYTFDVKQSKKLTREAGSAHLLVHGHKYRIPWVFLCTIFASLLPEAVWNEQKELGVQIPHWFDTITTELLARWRNSHNTFRVTLSRNTTQTFDTVFVAPSDPPRWVQDKPKWNMQKRFLRKPILRQPRARFLIDFTRRFYWKSFK